MDNPEKTLYNLLVANWPTTGNVRAAIITIQRADYNFDITDSTFNKTYVFIDNTGLRRHQQVSDLFTYTATVDVCHWVDTKSPTQLAVAKDLVWSGLEAAKKIIDDSSLKPAAFESMFVETVGNMTPDIPLPEVIYMRINVNIQINWSPS